MKGTDSLRKNLARRKKIGLVALAVLISIVLVVIDLLFISQGDKLYFVATIFGLISGGIVLVHEAATFNPWGLLGCGICLVSAPLWVAFYYEPYRIEFCLIAFYFAYGYVEAALYLPIQGEYQRLKAFAKPTN